MRKNTSLAWFLSLGSFGLLAALPAGCSNSTVDDTANEDAGALDLAARQDLAKSAPTYHYVVNSITLPSKESDFAADFIGDGMMRNKFGSITMLLAGQGLNLQTEETANLMNGEGLNLVSFATSDDTFANDATATASMYIATHTDKPDFSGNGAYVIDNTVPKGTLAGPLAGGGFASTDPLKLAMPPTVYIRLVLYAGVSVNMPVVGARLKLKPTKSSLLDGVLNGAMRRDDIDKILVPALTTALDKIAHSPTCDQGTPCDQVKSMFDKNKDGTISLDEVKNNPLVMALLGPDIQLFDDKGNWKPNKNNSIPDSISVGVGFKAVRAKFTE